MSTSTESPVCREIASAIRAGRSLLIATDYDGTLSPITPTPEAAGIPDETREALTRLAEYPACTVMVVSGRSIHDLRNRVPESLILSGNHGLEIEGAGLKFVHPAAMAAREQLDIICSRLENVVSQWPGAFVERKGLTASIHFRLVEETAQQDVTCAVRHAVMPGFGAHFELRAGKKVLEVHPRTDWDKGSAVNWVRDQLGLGDDLCVCIGDDTTDEAMFAKCRPAVTVVVGMDRPSQAEHRLQDPCAVQRVLQHTLRFLQNHADGGYTE